MFQPLTTERLTLRKLFPEDAAEVFAYRSDPEVARYQSWDPESADEIAEFLGAMQDEHLLQPGKWFQLGIVEQATGLLVGDCGIQARIDNRRQVELGITISRASHQRGFGCEAVRCVIDFLFSRTETHRVFCSIDPRNTASLGLAERVGMRKEAHLRESQWFKGEWADDVIYALLRSEWQEP